MITVFSYCIWPQVPAAPVAYFRPASALKHLYNAIRFTNLVESSHTQQ